MDGTFETQICMSCGQENELNAHFCSKCGAPLIPITPKQKPKKEKASKVAFKSGTILLIRNAVILFISLLVLLSAFLPIMKYPFSPNERVLDEANIKFSTIDIVTFFFDSLRNVDEEDLEDTKMYEKYIELLDKLMEIDTEDGISSKEERLLSRYAKFSVRVELMTDGKGPSINLIFAMALSLLYILLCLFFVVVSIINLSLFLNNRPSPFQATVTILCAVPGVLFALFFTFCICLGTNGGNASMGAGSVLALITTFSLIAILIALRYYQQKMYSIGGIVTRSLTFVLSMVIFILLLVAPLSSEITTVFANRSSESTATAQLHYDFFDFLGEIEDDAAYRALQESASTLFASFSDYTKLEIKQGAAMLENYRMACFSLLSADEAQVTPIFRLTPIFALILCIFNAGIMWQSLRFLVIGLDCRPVAITSKVGALFFAFLALAVLIAVVIIANISLDNSTLRDLPGSLDNYYRLHLNASTVFIYVLSMILLFIPSRLYSYKKFGKINATIETPEDVVEESPIAISKAESQEAPIQPTVPESLSNVPAKETIAPKPAHWPTHVEKKLDEPPVAPKRWRCKKCGRIIDSIPCSFCYEESKE